MILDVDVTAERRHYNTHRPLKGKRLTTFCASLRSGGRRLAVRTAMEHHIGALPRTPFPASRDFPSRGNEKIGGTGYCVTYDTDSQSRNADFILIARKGDTTTLGAKGPVKLKNPPAEGRSILRTFPIEPSEPSETCGLGPLWYCVPSFRPQVVVQQTLILKDLLLLFIKNAIFINEVAFIYKNACFYK